jgi:hypothetical protein
MMLPVRWTGRREGRIFVQGSVPLQNDKTIELDRNRQKLAE